MQGPGDAGLASPGEPGAASHPEGLAHTAQLPQGHGEGTAAGQRCVLSLQLSSHLSTPPQPEPGPLRERSHHPHLNLSMPIATLPSASHPSPFLPL